MATASDVLTSMRIGCIYRLCDVAAQLPGTTPQDVKRVLLMLEKGGLIECISGTGYRRTTLYKTRQQCFADQGRVIHA